MTASRATDWQALDRNDPLAGKKAAFRIPDGVIYLDGNSLGVLPEAVPARMAQAVEQEWGQSLIRAWNEHDWFTLPQRVGDRIGRLVGAAPGQVTACDNTSINVFKVLAAALSLNPQRKVILSDSGQFPPPTSTWRKACATCSTGGMSSRWSRPRRSPGHRRQRGRDDADAGRLSHGAPARHGRPDEKGA